MMDVLFAWLQASSSALWCAGVFVAGAVVGLVLSRVVARRMALAWIGGLVLGVASLGSVWAAEYFEPLPRFVLDTQDIGQVVPVGQGMLGWLADRVHGRKYLVLSFDDGPSNPRTDSAILAILARHHAHAVFFSVCAHAQSAEGRAALRADAAAGDLVEDHSWTHPHLPQESAAALHHEIADSRVFLRQLTGQPVDWFRPPFGQADAAVRAQIRQAGMQEVMWGANSEDSWLRSPAQIQYWSTRQAYNGAILLMHSHATTAAALDATLTDLEGMGYRFVIPSLHPDE
jgi:peptidoglycan/xylan/chitin deacetylase (PgdA/CDA1 family)